MFWGSFSFSGVGSLIPIEGRNRVSGEHIPQRLDKGGHNIICPCQYFVIKNNVVVQISSMPVIEVSETHVF